MAKPPVSNAAQRVRKKVRKNVADGIAQLLRREKVFAFRYQGTRYDCGSKLGFLQATVDLGVQHPEVGAEFSDWLHGQY